MTMASIRNLKNAEGLGETLKLGLGLVIGFAADMAVTALLRGHVPAGRGITKLMVKLGIFAIAMKVGEDVENHFYTMVDDAAACMKEAKEEAKKAVAEAMEEEKKSLEK